jgi:hypothetical protein
MTNLFPSTRTPEAVWALPSITSCAPTISGVKSIAGEAILGCRQA